MRTKFVNWLESRDPNLYQKIINEGLLDTIGNVGNVWTQILALAHSHGIDPSELTKYLHQHQQEKPAMVSTMHPEKSAKANVGGHAGSDKWNTSLTRGDHGNNHGDHGDHEDHASHLHAHLYGDKEKEDREEKLHKWFKGLGEKKGPPKPVTLPIFKQGPSGEPVPDESGQDFSSIPNLIRTPHGYKPGINPKSTGQLQYQQLMTGQKPNVQSGIGGEQEPINPRIAKFAARMKKAQQMRRGV